MFVLESPAAKFGGFRGRVIRTGKTGYVSEGNMGRGRWALVHPMTNANNKTAWNL